MLDWIKLESDLLSDARIQTLLGDLGLSGLGTYVLIRIQIDAQSMDGLPIERALSLGGQLTRKARLVKIINNYGLFSVDEQNNLHVCALSHDCVPGQTPGQTPGHRPGQRPAHRPGHKPTVEENIRNIDICYDNNKPFFPSEVSDCCNGMQSRTKRFQKPTIEQLQSYCEERQNGIDAVRFWDYYESKDWMVGRSRMKDWKAAVRTWERNATGTFHAVADKEVEVPQPISLKDGVQIFNGRPLPPTAPPRPSDTAEWDEASESWFDLYR